MANVWAEFGHIVSEDDWFNTYGAHLPLILFAQISRENAIALLDCASTVAWFRVFLLQITLIKPCKL